MTRGHFSEHLDEVAQRMEQARDEALRGRIDRPAIEGGEDE